MNKLTFARASSSSRIPPLKRPEHEDAKFFPLFSRYLSKKQKLRKEKISHLSSSSERKIICFEKFLE